MSDDELREQIALVMIAYDYNENEAVPGNFRRHVYATVDRILPLVSSAITEAKAGAWGEGYAACDDNYPVPLYLATNPYRTGKEPSNGND